MTLNKHQVELLEIAIKTYGFPNVYYDFKNNQKINANNMTDVETEIKSMLTSSVVEETKYGLANVLFWGYAQIGYRDKRVARFINGVTKDQITGFQKMLLNKNIPTLNQIKNLKMPEYSGISFISKILTFLDPVNYCVLDKQLAKLADGTGDCALYNLRYGTQIMVTDHNQKIYDAWRTECRVISKDYFNGKYRVVDVERGFFQLIQSDKLDLASQIYASVPELL